MIDYADHGHIIFKVSPWKKYIIFLAEKMLIKANICVLKSISQLIYIANREKIWFVHIEMNEGIEVYYWMR